MLLWKNKAIPFPQFAKPAANLAGDSSYALYLSHQPLLTLLSCFVPRLSVYLAVLAAVILSVAMVVLIERPIRNWLRRRSHQTGRNLGKPCVERRVAGVVQVDLVGVVICVVVGCPCRADARNRTDVKESICE